MAMLENDFRLCTRVIPANNIACQSQRNMKVLR